MMSSEPLLWDKIKQSNWNYINNYILVVHESNDIWSSFKEITLTSSSRQKYMKCFVWHKRLVLCSVWEIFHLQLHVRNLVSFNMEQIEWKQSISRNFKRQYHFSKRFKASKSRTLKLPSNSAQSQRHWTLKFYENSPEHLDCGINSDVILLTNISPVKTVDTGQLDCEITNI